MADFFASGPQMPLDWAAGRLREVGVDDDGVGGVDEVGDGGDGSTVDGSTLHFFSSPLFSDVCDEGPFVVVVVVVVVAALAALAHPAEQ